MTNNNEGLFLAILVPVCLVLVILSMLTPSGIQTLESEIGTLEYTRVEWLLTEHPELDKNAKGMMENDGIITINEYRWLMKQRDKYRKEAIKKRINAR